MGWSCSGGRAGELGRRARWEGAEADIDAGYASAGGLPGHPMVLDGLEQRRSVCNVTALGAPARL